VFKRYDIVEEQDLKAGVEALNRGRPSLGRVLDTVNGRCG
jgi:hypothetical protein